MGVASVSEPRRTVCRNLMWRWPGGREQGVDPPAIPTCLHRVTRIAFPIAGVICVPSRRHAAADMAQTQHSGPISGQMLSVQARPCLPTPSAALSQKLRKVRISLLTGWDVATIHHLTNEGGAPLATKKFASTTALAGNHREPRYATLYRVRSASERSTTLRLRCLFFDNCILKKEKRGRHCPAEPLALPGAFGSNRDFGGHVSRE